MAAPLRHFLVIRLSAMGDVVLAAQVIRQVLAQHEDVVLHIITRPTYQAFFKGVERVYFVTPDIYGKHKGFFGLNRLAREIRQTQAIDGVIDLHDVLRSIILRSHFALRGIPTYHIEKDRKTRKALTRKEDKDYSPLQSIIERMGAVFQQAGLHLQTVPYASYAEDYPFTVSLPTGTRIGIAPSASTQEKTYPRQHMRKVVAMLLTQGHHIYAFGGGKKDLDIWEDWQTLEGADSLHNVMRDHSLADQLALMTQMTLMLTMDSSNMHMARLLGVPVLSIWGATHPAGGYAPFGVEDEGMLIQMPVENVPCRPCSIFGNKACFRDRMYCLEDIQPEDVVDRVKEYATKLST